MPRILFVSMQSSPHTARWVECVADAGWDLHMFGIDAHPPNPLLRGVMLHWPQAPLASAVGSALVQAIASLTPVARTLRFARYLREEPRAALGVLRSKLVGGLGAEIAVSTAEPAAEAASVRIEVFRATSEEVGPDAAARIPFGDTGADCVALHGPRVLASLIRRLKPDLIHSMEFQHCAYLVMAARDLLGEEGFPPWLATNWGSDIYLFGRDPRHAAEIRRVLRAADLYSCECQRDVALVREFGFAGPVLPVLPNSGGMDLAKLARLRDPTPPSRRRLLMVKGYDHFAGRAMVSLAVLERFADRLRDYEVVMFSVGARPRARALELRAQGTLNIRVIAWATHDDILRHFGRARIYLGVSISDAISTSVLEAMAMGAFPIQTNTSCCEEWIEDGISGFAIPPDDFEVICDRFARALADDALVDRAAEINRATITARLAQQVVQRRVRDFYAEAFAHTGARVEG